VVVIADRKLATSASTRHPPPGATGLRQRLPPIAPQESDAPQLIVDEGDLVARSPSVAKTTDRDASKRRRYPPRCTRCSRGSCESIAPARAHEIEDSHTGSGSPISTVLEAGDVLCSAPSPRLRRKVRFGSGRNRDAFCFFSSAACCRHAYAASWVRPQNSKRPPCTNRNTETGRPFRVPSTRSASETSARHVIDHRARRSAVQKSEPVHEIGLVDLEVQTLESAISSPLCFEHVGILDRIRCERFSGGGRPQEQLTLLPRSNRPPLLFDRTKLLARPLAASRSSSRDSTLKRRLRFILHPASTCEFARPEGMSGPFQEGALSLHVRNTRRLSKRDRSLRPKRLATGKEQNVPRIRRAHLVFLREWSGPKLTSLSVPTGGVIRKLIDHIPPAPVRL